MPLIYSLSYSFCERVKDHIENLLSKDEALHVELFTMPEEIHGLKFRDAHSRREAFVFLRSDTMRVGYILSSVPHWEAVKDSLESFQVAGNTIVSNGKLPATEYLRVGEIILEFLIHNRVRE